MSDGTRRLVIRAGIGAESPIWDEEGVMGLAGQPAAPVEPETGPDEVGGGCWEGDDEVVDAEGRRLYREVVDALAPTEVVWDND
jgi:hypothetical protein